MSKMTASGEDVESNNVELKKEEAINKDESLTNIELKGKEKEVEESKMTRNKEQVKINGEIPEKQDSDVLKGVKDVKDVKDTKEIKEVKATKEVEEVKIVEEDKPVEKAKSPKEQRAKVPPAKDKVDKIKQPTQPTTKHTLRMQTWSKLDNADMVLFPKPCTYRIPRFKGEVEAAQKLAGLDVFKAAKVIKVTLDKAHECVRLQVIEAGKELIAGAPGLREAVFLHMRPPVDPNKSAVRMASSRAGINHLGAALKFDQETKADLIVVGAVAVDRKGHRIGKGEGFSDLEFALLTKLGAIADGAPIVTVVHDMQVYDSLPEELFKSFDVPVDYIVTPTQVIEVKPTLPRPSLQWNLLSNRRVNSIPIIKQLLDREQTNGIKIELKEPDSDVEDRQVRRFRPNIMRRRRFSRTTRRRRDMSAPERRNPPRAPMPPREGSAPPAPRTTRTRTFRRRVRNSEGQANKEPHPGDSANQTVEGNQTVPSRKPVPPGRMRKITRPRFPVDFTIRVNGLTAGIRIRDLKAALMERGVRPRDISWRGTKGIAFLHFSKGKPNLPEAPIAVDDIVASLQGLKVKAEGTDGPGADVKVEPAIPVTRIEVLNVAQV